MNNYDHNNQPASEIDDIIQILDNFASSGENRLKIDVSDELDNGESKKIHHHGRCDIGSPFACGNAFNSDTEK